MQGTPSYDAQATLTVFNLHTVATALPRTSLSGVARIRGAGSDPRTMRATIAADLRGSAIDSVSFDSARVRLTIADGLGDRATHQRHTSFAKADVRGTFGLVADRNGELSYHVDVDSISGSHVAAEAGHEPRRPPASGRRAKAIREARKDSALVARATEVERAATGGAAPVLKVDSLPEPRRDSLGGSVAAAGTIKGNLQRFDLRGRAAVENLAVSGNTVRRGRVEYGWLAARTPASTMVAALSLDTVQAAGFALDSVEARVTSHGSTGKVDVAIHQHESYDYRLSGNFALHPEHREVHLDRLQLRFDTNEWGRLARAPPLGTRGIEIARSIFAKDRGASTWNVSSHRGHARFDVEIAGLEVAHVVELLQSDIEATGVLQVWRAGGHDARPRVRAALGITGVSIGARWARLRARFTSREVLDAQAEVLRGTGTPVAVAKCDSDQPRPGGVTGPDCWTGPSSSSFARTRSRWTCSQSSLTPSVRFAATW